MKERARTSEALAAVAATTLGGTEEEVDSALRERLNAVASAQGLGGIQVETSRPVAEASPAGRSKLRGTMARGLRRRTDFWVVGGSLTGQGTLEQALRTLAALQSQAWVHRVESFSIKPEGKERDRFELRVGVGTLMMPDLLKAGYVPPAIVAPGDTSIGVLGAVAAKNPFRVPPPDQVVASRPPPAAASPHADWRLTGIVEGGGRAEAWMHNTRSNERLTLAAGAKVVDATLLTASGERAIFEIGGKRFEVLNGQTLEQRRPVD